MCNLGSRRSVEELVLNGEVIVNGEKCLDLATEIDINNDVVMVAGETLKVSDKKIYIAMNKPKGYLVTKSDELNRKTVFDLLPDFGVNFFAVGRLDKDSEGLLILTNDGDFANKIMHPSYKLSKIYKVEIGGQITNGELKQLQDGIELDGEMTMPARVFVKKSNDSSTTLRFTIYEGRNRQIRRMIEALGLEVTSLRRLQVGGIKLNDLPVGMFRPLKKYEIASIFSDTGEYSKDEEDDDSFEDNAIKRERKNDNFRGRRGFDSERTRDQGEGRERSFSRPRFSERKERDTNTRFNRDDNRGPRRSFDRDDSRGPRRSFDRDRRDFRENDDRRGSFNRNNRYSSSENEDRTSDRRSFTDRPEGSSRYSRDKGQFSDGDRGTRSNRPPRFENERGGRYRDSGAERNSYDRDKPRSNFRPRVAEERGGGRDFSRREDERGSFRKDYSPRAEGSERPRREDRFEGNRFDRDRKGRPDQRSFSRDRQSRDSFRDNKSRRGR